MRRMRLKTETEVSSYRAANALMSPAPARRSRSAHLLSSMTWNIKSDSSTLQKCGDHTDEFFPKPSPKSIVQNVTSISKKGQAGESTVEISCFVSGSQRRVRHWGRSYGHSVVGRRVPDS